jgi:hypothetical protein
METVPLDKVEFLEYKVYSAQMTDFKNQHLVSSNCQDTLQILFKKTKLPLSQFVMIKFEMRKSLVAVAS